MGHYDSFYESEAQDRERARQEAEKKKLTSLREQREERFAELLTKPITKYSDAQLRFLLFAHEKVDKLILLQDYLNMFLNNAG